MTVRQRKFAGVLLFLGLIIAWSVLATAVYLLLPSGLPGVVLIVYFAVAGAGWAFPAAWLIRWMSKPDKD
jgi:Na+/melibiose symporter-like transporter